MRPSALNNMVDKPAPTCIGRRWKESEMMLQQLAGRTAG